MECISACAQVGVHVLSESLYAHRCLCVCVHAHRRKQDSVVFSYRATRRNTQNVYLSLSVSHFATWGVRRLCCCVPSETPINTLTSRQVVIPAVTCRLLEIMGSSLDRCWAEMRTCAFRAAEVPCEVSGELWSDDCGVVLR